MAIEANPLHAVGPVGRWLAEARRAVASPPPDIDAENDEAAVATPGRQSSATLKSLEMADDMAAIAAQFRNRRELEKKPAAVSEGLDRVLDEQVDAKLLKLQQISAARDLSMRSLLAQSRSLFPDESDLFLVLAELGRRTQLPQAQRDRLKLLQQHLELESDTRNLHGGINCALKARLFGRALEVKASLLRQTYRRFLCGDQEPLDHYEEWIATYGTRARHTVLDFVQESLACDIRSSDPSCSLLEFGDRLDSMQRLRALRTTDTEFVGGLSRRQLVHTSDEESYWILALCSLLRPLDDAPATLMEMMREGDATTPAMRAQWLNAVRAACKALPEGLRAGGMSPSLFALIDEMAAAYHAAERPTPGHAC